MEETIFAALISGLVATVITIWWQEISQKKKEKIKIFEVLMAKRYEISSEESVEALNKIDVVFYNSDNVRNAWKAFCDAANSSELTLTQKPQLIMDKHLKLLEEIAKDIGYKKIQWDNIKDYYYPTGLATKKQNEAFLTKVQIDAGLAQIDKSSDDENTAQIDKKDELANKLLFEAMENPDKLLKLMKVAEKAQKFNK